ncbi:MULTISPECIES: NCS2 family permease [unclassified Campylobacter]|uniref:NCS2 family permease n=1 Tax=unclassified Campylobacter TaxID=2593542 RepID=UPI0022E9F1CC|nr:MULTISPECIES: NCS2 family permease [unclassified Campylobacter]MDA3055855.1 NCS2 family permease [Campylobacter sp. CN_NA1]MDA3065859.1 NCS2 family permease [Campylobacter sp. CN_NE4]MDA3068711.1 NCS2 family permease [Campylobacter sp. CN_NE3]MDA3081966.1 NCS2 family permease [Campylobacter sp. CN_EL2]MDA3084296.1 NCS2 family permease [Campylobacter sp. CN_NE1]
MKFFELDENKTSVKQELNAGITTFLAMIYIVPVNAIIMSGTGMPYEALITATALITILATLFNGLYANTPVALSVGMGLNAYFTFGLCKSAEIPWQTALGIVFLSGLLFTILSFTNFRIWVIKSIPLDLRRAISAGIGAFICFIGLKQMGVIVENPATLVGLGNLKDPNVALGVFGLLIIIALFVLKVRASFILGILITSVVAWVFGISPKPEGLVSLPSSVAPIFGQLDIKGALQLAFLPFIITFFVTHLFDSIGTLTGVGNRAKIFSDEDPKGMKKLARNLTADAVGSVGGAVMGTSTVTAFAESASGVEAGGRTGLTAVFVALCFILTLFMLPLFKAIPSNAIYPVLVMVGILMFSELGKLDYSDVGILIPAFFIVMLMPFTYSITNGLSFGFISYLFVRLLQRRFSDINLGVLVLAGISLLVFAVA